MPDSSGPKRRVFALNAETGDELKAGRQDVTNVFQLLTDQSLGSCTDSGSEMIVNCPNRYAFEQSLEKFLGNWSFHDQLIFYYTGHGDVRKNRFGLLFSEQYYPFGNLLNEFDAADVRRAIVILDACRSGAASLKSSTTLKDTLPSKSELPRGIAILASSRASQPSEEISEETISVFTKLFCEGIRTGLGGKPTPTNTISVEDILDYIRGKLATDKEYLHFRQRPVASIDNADKSVWIARNVSRYHQKSVESSSLIHTGVDTNELNLLYQRVPPQLHPCSDVSIEDLDWELLLEYAQKRNSQFDDTMPGWQERILEQLHLYSEIPVAGRRCLHKSAVLCFHSLPQNIEHSSGIIVSVDVANSELRIREHVIGPLFRQFLRIMELFDEHVPNISVTEPSGRRRDRVPIFDRDVVREAISNAIAHRNYVSHQNSEVRVTFTEEHVEVRSPGGFPFGHTWDSLISSTDRPSNSVNEAIASYLAVLGGVEKEGQGFKTFRRYLQENGPASITHEYIHGSTIICVKRIPQSLSSITPRYLSSITAANVAIGGKQTIIVDGHVVELPGRSDIVAYLEQVESAYSRWADYPKSLENLIHPSDDGQSDAYIDLNARPLPMRISAYRLDLGSGDLSPAQDLVAALTSSQRTIILGMPGIGKTAALERLAWVISSMVRDTSGETSLSVPVLVRLSDYQGESDLISLLRRSINRFGELKLSDVSTQLVLNAENIQWIMLLDGLSEVAPEHRASLQHAVRRYMDDYPLHTVHVTCRTQDFDPVTLLDPERQILSEAVSWEIQPLVDEIRYWDDGDGYSDLRGYLRHQLGEREGKRLYERIRSDERLQELARIPLFLWMLKETAAGTDGNLPVNRGILLERFIRSPRLLGRVPKEYRSPAEKSLEAICWQIQLNASLVIDEDTLFEVLAKVRGARSYKLDEMRRHLESTGLLVETGNETYRLMHQSIQEYGAAAYLAKLRDCAKQLQGLAKQEWWRETCILALWLGPDMQASDYLLGLVNKPEIDLHVRFAAGEIVGEIGDPRLIRKVYADGVEAIEPQMVKIAATESIIGSEDTDASDDEKPECSVFVDAFELAAFPVTNAEFACFINAGGYEDESLWLEAGKKWLQGESQLDAETEQLYRQFHRELVEDTEVFLDRMKAQTYLSEQDSDTYRHLALYNEEEFVKFYKDAIRGGQRRVPVYWNDRRYNLPNQPVVGVNLYEAQAYTMWLSKLTGKTYRLPTEVEWESAARRNELIYPWGNEWDSTRCNWRDSRLMRGHPLGIYPHGVTENGLHDMAGNVLEWTVNLYKPYPYIAGDGRQDIETEGLRVIRGGSWGSLRERVRCTARHYAQVYETRNSLGFRLAAPNSDH